MSVGARLLRWGCLATLGALSVPPQDAALVAGAAVSALLAGGVAVWALDRLLRAGLASIDPTEAAARTRAAIDAGFLSLLPYSVLAALAGAGLGWSLAPAFVGAGLLGAGSIAGAGVARDGGRPLWCALAPMLVLLPLVAAWTWVAALAAQGVAP
ncbi:MAG: hypothetical protein JNL89_15080 [Rhodanobacteraceae bacterium]|jgi:hypothetical protein|nr:hypothetical protein [Rhodanobacteraceae bacterium]